MRKSLLLVLTSNRGLCGGYNGGILRAANEAIRSLREAHTPFDLDVSGKRGINFFRFQGVPRGREYTQFEDKPAFAEVDLVGNRLIDLFVTGQVDRCRWRTCSSSTPPGSRPVVETLLPLSSVAVETRKAGRRGPALGRRSTTSSCPSAADILEELVPVAFKVRLFKCFLDAAVSEQIARRVAMKAATENAGDLIKDLTRVYNRTRQANITKEISELIGGSEALK